MPMKDMDTRVLTMVLLVVTTVIPAFGIWNPGDPNVMHFPQLPDISETGLDVLATPTALAEDFRSSQTALMTDIILWGGWLDDQIGPLDLDVALFSNIPAGAGDIPYSRPGDLLWFRSVPDEEIEATGVGIFEMGIYDASLNEVIGLTTVVMQYHITIDPNVAFWQEKDTVYWLVIQRPNLDDGNIFGWKTSFNHFNGAGVFEYVPPGGGQPEIRQLLYPITHQFVGQYIDLAFVVATSAPTLSDGNFDGDGDVDLTDFAIFAAAWLTEEGQGRWNPDCDISSPADGLIDIMDLAVFVEHWLEGAK